MVITDAAGRKVNSFVDFREALANRPEGRDLLIRILKGTKAEFRVMVNRSEDPEPAKKPVDLLPLESPDAGPVNR